MAVTMTFGKYKGTSLEEIALGKRCSGGGGKSEGYFYFNQLAKGDPKYFKIFQNSRYFMNRWEEIRHQLNNFIPAYKCECGKDSTVMSIAGSRQFGYSMGTSYVACDDKNCQQGLTAMPSSGTQLYKIGFDAILDFGWNDGGTKFDERKVTELLLQLAGWQHKRMDANNATSFIDNLKTR